MPWDGTALAHVTTGDLATASRQNSVLDDIALLKTSISDDGLSWSGFVSKHPSLFTGLRLRTHPDADQAANKVYLAALASIVMNDGTYYSGLTLPLTADITASGAGGLDTGARAASTWYEMHLVGKSSTKAAADLRLIFHKAKQYAIDQSQTTDNTSEKLRQGATDRVKLAQGFKASVLQPIEYVDIRIGRIASPTGNIWLTIESDSSGSPSGSVLATSDKIDVSQLLTDTGLGTSPAWLVRFPFRTPFTPASGATQYHVVLQGDYTASAVNYINWHGNSADAYANGSAKKFDGTTWAAAVGPADFWFQTNTGTPTAAITFPAGYDESCKLGYVYNNGSNVLVPFLASDKRQRLLAAASVSLNVGSGGSGYFQDTTTLTPPTPHRAFWSFNLATPGMILDVGTVPDGYKVGSTSMPSPGLGGVMVVSNVGAAIAQFLPGAAADAEWPGLYFLSQTGSGTTGYLDAWEWVS